MPLAADAGLRLAHVRVRDRGGDALAVQLGVRRLLDAARVRPTAVPPAAILLVRSMEDPLPGALRPDTVLPPDTWERAFARTLDALARSAARPARGPVPSTAGAVLFADRAELLACLARDSLHGVAGELWWWRLVGPVRGRTPALAEAFVEAPEHVPAAFEQLAATGDAVAVAASLGEVEAHRSLEAVRRVFQLPARIVGSDAPRAESAAPVRDEPASTTRPAELHEPAAPVLAPWLDLVPETREAALPPAAEELLATALVLRRAPALARSHAFAAAVGAWRARRKAAALDSPRPEAHAREPATSAPAPADARREPGEARDGREPSGRPQEARPRIAAPKRTADAAPPVEPPPDVEVPAAAAASAEPAKPVPDEDLPRAHARARETEPEPALLPVVTGLGGCFYLLNAALALGLYGDFTTPAQPGIELDPWDFVTLLTEALLAEPHPDDAVWPLLAGLAGRAEGGPPGRGFDPPVPLARWVENLAAYLRVRLGAALDAPDPRTLSSRLLEHRADVFATATHVDVVLRLDELPLEIRRAGLDRTPGWIPAAGRFLAFHFE